MSSGNLVPSSLSVKVIENVSIHGNIMQYNVVVTVSLSGWLDSPNGCIIGRICPHCEHAYRQ